MKREGTEGWYVVEELSAEGESKGVSAPPPGGGPPNSPERAPKPVALPDSKPSGANRKVFLDENVYFMEAELKKAGFAVEKVPSGTKDPEVRALVESQNGILVTRNYKDFKAMQGVVRVSGTNPLPEQTATTIRSLAQVREDPRLWATSDGQAPASGFNKGHFRQLK